MNKIEIKVKGMVCSECEKRIENALMNIDGVVSVKADHDKELVVIETNKNVDKEEIERKIIDLDFKVIKEN